MLIGTSRYERLSDLLAVGQGVNDLKKTLTDPVYGLVPESYCDTLQDEADIRLIGQRLKAVAGEAEDMLLVYFAGHGLRAGRRHELYLALRGTEPEGPEFSGLQYEKLRDEVLKSPAATKIIILDCCFSSRAFGESMADPTTALMDQIEVDGTYVLASAGRDALALILPNEKYPAFTGRLLRLFHDGVPGGPELLTIDDIYQRLRVTMKAEGLPLPHKRVTDNASLLAVARNRAFVATAVPLLLQRQQAAIELGERGDWGGAALALRDLLEEQARVMGPENRDTLRTRQFLAHATGGAGDPQEGAVQLWKLLAEQTRILGPDHADALQTRQFLAVDLHKAGYRDEAVKMLRLLLPDCKRVLGNDDPRTLRTAHILARNLAALGEVDEAITLLEEVVATRERILGPDHPHTIFALRDLAPLVETTAANSDQSLWQTPTDDLGHWLAPQHTPVGVSDPVTVRNPRPFSSVSVTSSPKEPASSDKSNDVAIGFVFLLVAAAAGGLPFLIMQPIINHGEGSFGEAIISLICGLSVLVGAPVALLIAIGSFLGRR